MAVDSRCHGVPMAMLMQTPVDQEVEISGACSAVARIPGITWERSKRAHREAMIAQVLAPTWVSDAVLKRTGRILRIVEGAPASLDYAQVHGLRALVPALTPGWAAIATRPCLNSWMESHHPTGCTTVCGGTAASVVVLPLTFVWSGSISTWQGHSTTTLRHTMRLRPLMASGRHRSARTPGGPSAEIVWRAQPTRRFVHGAGIAVPWQSRAWTRYRSRPLSRPAQQFVAFGPVAQAAPRQRQATGHLPGLHGGSGELRPERGREGRRAHRCGRRCPSMRGLASYHLRPYVLVPLSSSASAQVHTCTRHRRRRWHMCLRRRQRWYVDWPP